MTTKCFDFRCEAEFWASCLRELGHSPTITNDDGKWVVTWKKERRSWECLIVRNTETGLVGVVLRPVRDIRPTHDGKWVWVLPDDNGPAVRWEVSSTQTVPGYPTKI